jgi:hypothetical protein
MSNNIKYQEGFEASKFKNVKNVSMATDINQNAGITQ